MRRSTCKQDRNTGKSLMGIIFIGLLFIGGCGQQANRADEEKRILVGAGAGLKIVLDPLAEIFTQKTGIQVEYSYLCSGTLLSNMRLTKTGDIMVPGDQYYLDIAVEKGLIDPNAVSIAGFMIPIIAVQKGNPLNIQTIEDLTRPGLRVGVGEPEALAVGRLTEEMLKDIGIYEDVMKNVVLTGGSATKLIMPLAMGNLDVQINWRPVAHAFHEKVDTILIDPEKLKYSVAPIGMTTFTEKEELARKYLDFVASDEGRALFAQYGYGAYFDTNKVGTTQ